MDTMLLLEGLQGKSTTTVGLCQALGAYLDNKVYYMFLSLLSLVSFSICLYLLYLSYEVLLLFRLLLLVFANHHKDRPLESKEVQLVVDMVR